nr:SLC13 family permease [Pandoraea terrae]
MTDERAGAMRVIHALGITVDAVRRDPVLLILLAGFAAVQFLHPATAAELFTRVDWRTVLTLTGLLVLTKAIELSSFLDWLAQRLLRAFRNERRLALLMVVFAAGLSTVLTNDVALFAVVPLALSLSRIAPIRIERLIIFLALAVNAGSSLTPLGNPQNLFLWQQSGMGFGAFVVLMAPLSLALMAVLLAITWCAFAPRALHFHQQGPSHDVRWPLFALSLVLFAGFVALADHGLGPWACALAVVPLLAVRRDAVLRIDWLLLLIFVMMFIVLRGVAGLPALRTVLAHIDLDAGQTAYWAAAGLSQIVSNVPSAILLADYSRKWPALAYGVSVGGFGLAVGSLANLIALRMAKSARIWWRFHWASIPFFVLALGLGHALQGAR